VFGEIGYRLIMIEFLKRLFGLKENTEVEDPMKYLIVGLGNIGPKYVGTRHNIGFEALDYLNSELGGKFEIVTQGALSFCKYKGRQIYLLKPSTYVNLSGKAVRYWMQKKKILPKNLLVVIDDLNLQLNTIRLRKNGSDGGHNGLKNIDQLLGSNDYARLRIGIGNEFGKGRQVDFVLGKWTQEELDKLPEILGKTTDTIKSFTTIGIERTMNQYNTK